MLSQSGARGRPNAWLERAAAEWLAAASMLCNTQCTARRTHTFRGGRVTVQFQALQGVGTAEFLRE
jgi:hypothetical protein